MRVLEILEYTTPEGKSPFRAWFNRLDAQAAARVTIALTRLEQGNVSNLKSVGSGVHELKIQTGPGYRVYFGKTGNPKTESHWVILLAGGTKRRQQQDIETAQRHWQAFQRQRKAGSTGISPWH